MPCRDGRIGELGAVSGIDLSQLARDGEGQATAAVLVCCVGELLGWLFKSALSEIFTLRGDGKTTRLAKSYWVEI